MRSEEVLEGMEVEDGGGMGFRSLRSCTVLSSKESKLTWYLSSSRPSASTLLFHFHHT